ncbi:hypothetical protein F3Y22_tig00112285pilonHSYRG00495 [Hibiscus syriacus]|uniref:Uncharacterized protein n=1 Tax=Hibiscus syriacus TaxID=106335 RepID=A0A6A2Y6Y5_HIBSY|nr:hypothetical protein F3Y22_tig00112285pilonHSYRG00495 [Hibiscus syriacus]
MWSSKGFEELWRPQGSLGGGYDSGVVISGEDLEVIRFTRFCVFPYTVVALLYPSQARVYCGVVTSVRTQVMPTEAFAGALKFSGLIFVTFDRPWTYIGATGSPSEASFGATLATENLLTSDEAVIAAAAAKAVALARAAAKWALFTEAEMAGIVGDSPSEELELEEEELEQNSTKESDELEFTSDELKLLKEQLSGSIAVRSMHQTERKAKEQEQHKRVLSTTWFL